jgi:LPS-assembly protein
VSLPAAAQELARLFDTRSGAVRFEADRIRADLKRDRVVARGNVRMTRGDAVLECEEVVIDQAAGRARARGDVRVRSGQRVLLLRELELDLVSMVTVLRGAEIYVKEGITAEALRALSGRRALRRAGTNALSVSGGRLVKGPGPSYYVEDGSITPCDCGEDPPSWKITTPQMAVDPEDGAWLVRPTFRVGDTGLFTLPAIWVPFGEHRTGLLQPQVGYTGINGWLAQGAFFWAVRRWLDLTFQVDWLENRGFRPGLEMRYAAAPGSFGRIAGGWIDDDRAKIQRFNLDGYVRQEIAPGASLSLDFALVSDTHYILEYFYAVRDRSLEYLSSTLSLEAARGDHAALVAADWFQDLMGGTGPRIDLFSSQAGATVQRLPRASYHLLPRPLGDTPLLLSLRAGLTHFWRTGESFDEAASAPGYEVGDPVRVYRRLDVGVGLSAPLDLAGLTLTPRAAYRQLVYDASVPGFPATRGHLLVGADLAAPFSRVFGAPPRGPAPVGSWRHVVEPVVAWRYVPSTYDRGSGLASSLFGLDDLDELSRTHRLYAGVRTRLVRKTGESSYSVPLTARLTQGFDLGAHGLLDTRLRTQGEVGPVSGTLDLSYDPKHGRLDESLVSLVLRDSRGDSLSFSYNFLRATRHERFDLEDVESPLFRGAIARPFLPGEIHEVVVSPSLRMPIPLTLSWTLHYSFTLKDIVQSVYSIRYESPCRCWSVSLQVAQVIGISLPIVGFFLNLTGLGSGGTPALMF